jgi:phosphoribosylformylglycinamidine cyclo-ligase
VLSPTRTYAPLLKQIFNELFEAVHGVIHCSGGGQTKCMKYLPGPMHIIKDNLFKAPIVFDLIADASGSDAREMYQVFNMGHRLEVFTDMDSAELMIDMAKSLGIDAQVIGRVEASAVKELSLTVNNEVIKF